MKWQRRPFSVMVKSAGAKCREHILVYLLRVQFGTVSLLILTIKVFSIASFFGSEWKVTLPCPASTYLINVHCGTQQLLLLLLALPGLPSMARLISAGKNERTNN